MPDGKARRRAGSVHGFGLPDLRHVGQRYVARGHLRLTTQRRDTSIAPPDRAPATLQPARGAALSMFVSARLKVD